MLSGKNDDLKQKVILISYLSTRIKKRKQGKQVFMGMLVLQMLWYSALIYCIQYLIGNIQIKEYAS